MPWKCTMAGGPSQLPTKCMGQARPSGGTLGSTTARTYSIRRRSSRRILVTTPGNQVQLYRDGVDERLVRILKTGDPRHLVL